MNTSPNKEKESCELSSSQRPIERLVTTLVKWGGGAGGPAAEVMAEAADALIIRENALRELADAPYIYGHEVAAIARRALEDE